MDLRVCRLRHRAIAFSIRRGNRRCAGWRRCRLHVGSNEAEFGLAAAPRQGNGPVRLSGTAAIHRWDSFSSSSGSFRLSRFRPSFSCRVHCSGAFLTETPANLYLTLAVQRTRRRARPVPSTLPFGMRHRAADLEMLRGTPRGLSAVTTRRNLASGGGDDRIEIPGSRSLSRGIDWLQPESELAQSANLLIAPLPLTSNGSWHWCRVSSERRSQARFAGATPATRLGCRPRLS